MTEIKDANKIKNIERRRAYNIFCLDAIREEIENFEKKYWYLIDSFGASPIGNSYVIAIDDVDEEDRNIFEKNSTIVNAIEFKGDLGDFEDFMNTTTFGNNSEWFVNNEEEFGLICEKASVHLNELDVLVKYDLRGK